MNHRLKICGVLIIVIFFLIVLILVLSAVNKDNILTKNPSIRSDIDVKKSKERTLIQDLMDIMYEENMADASYEYNGKKFIVSVERNVTDSYDFIVDSILKTWPAEHQIYVMKNNDTSVDNEFKNTLMGFELNYRKYNPESTEPTLFCLVSVYSTHDGNLIFSIQNEDDCEVASEDIEYVNSLLKKWFEYYIH